MLYDIDSKYTEIHFCGLANSQFLKVFYVLKKKYSPFVGGSGSTIKCQLSQESWLWFLKLFLSLFDFISLLNLFGIFMDLLLKSTSFCFLKFQFILLSSQRF